MFPLESRRGIQNWVCSNRTHDGDGIKNREGEREGGRQGRREGERERRKEGEKEGRREAL